MQHINTLNEFQNYINKNKITNEVIQTIFENPAFQKTEYLVYCLQHGYKITCRDREIMRDNCEREDYKRYATLSRLAYYLYEKGRPDLIEKLFSTYGAFTSAIYTIESLIQDKPIYFDYKTNAWLCIANNAITHYREYWIFIEAALKQYGKWEEVYGINSFKTKYESIDKKEILQWKDPIQYEILSLLYPQLKVPAIQIKEEAVPPYEQAKALFQESELTNTLMKLCTTIENQNSNWDLNAGKIAKEKIYSLWNTLPHDTFFEALFSLSDSRDSYIILKLLKAYAKDDIIDTIYNSDIYNKLQTGLEAGTISHPGILFLLWEIGYRHHTDQNWQKHGNLTSVAQVKLYCMDKFYGNNLGIDLKKIMDSHIIRVISMVEAIKNNDLFFTDMHSWKAYINSVRGSAKRHPLYQYWGYIDMALDGYYHAVQSMRNYLLSKEPGIRLERSQENIILDSDLYKALSILYPEVYK